MTKEGLGRIPEGGRFMLGLGGSEKEPFERGSGER